MELILYKINIHIFLTKCKNSLRIHVHSAQVVIDVSLN